MICKQVDERLSEFLDGALKESDRQEVASHMIRCNQCGARYEQHRTLRAGLRALQTPKVPESLRTSLMVAASREIARRATHSSLAARFNDSIANLQLWAHNLMRPLALPFAGGLVSTVFLFSMLVPTFPTFVAHDKDTIQDVPTVLATDPLLKSSPSFGLSDSGDIVVDLLIDEQGRMVDYSIPAGQPWQKDPELRRSVENTLLFTQFVPATNFGMPLSGKARITLRRSHVDVRG